MKRKQTSENSTQEAEFDKFMFELVEEAATEKKRQIWQQIHEEAERSVAEGYLARSKKKKRKRH